MLRTLLLLLAVTAAAQPPRPRVYSHLMNPREHPDDTRHHVRPPDWSTFGHRTQFTSLRGIEEKNGRLVNFSQEMERYTRTHELGDVLWLSYPVLFAQNLDELADEINRRQLYLFDIWGYVPGSGRGGYWQQFKPPADVFPLLEAKLGDRWLGMDIGEQDGRYLGYSRMVWPPNASRFEQYLSFQRHFERMTTELGNKVSALVSLNFGHYFLKEGLYTLIGAETAQALPNSQVYYSFIRGAGKQYGVPWFGNASIFNRWGYKTYDSSGVSEGLQHGPTKGTSLSLLKRLIYTHILYNSMLAGFESSWFDKEALSPVGRIQQAANRWVKQHGQPGVLHTPIALMTGFYAGWTFPRQLYSGDTFRVWGTLPYTEGDYLTHGVLEMLYPGYQDSSYFHDESGFLTATPFGDAADVLLSDAPGWLLDRYPVLVIAGDLTLDAELRARLDAYVRNGGWLLMPGDAATVQAVRRPVGKGWITVLPGRFAIDENPAEPPKGAIDKTLANPHPLLAGARVALAEAFQSQVLFEAGEGLNLITCRRAPRLYTLGITNNALEPRPFAIRSRIGRIESIRELPLDQSEKTAIGYLPENFEKAPIGSSDSHTIAGGDVRIFHVALAEEQIDEIPHVVPPPRPRNRNLELYSATSIKDELLARPTFFQNYDGVIVDWKCLANRDAAALGREAGWIARNKLSVTVDLTSGINLYPDLRLVNNIEEDYQASLKTIEELMAKMEITGSRNLILALHRFPENNMTRQEAMASFEQTLRRIANQAQARNITLHLRVAPGRALKDRAEAEAFLRRVDAPNLRIQE
ncbi:MAG: hypothetical protein NTY38_18210 [Acidobacteria bacterium]|nr:hypothetical protein [Acidobacteriota bacterium]